MAAQVTFRRSVGTYTRTANVRCGVFGAQLTLTVTPEDDSASAECDGCGWYISGSAIGQADEYDSVREWLFELLADAVHCHAIGATDS